MKSERRTKETSFVLRDKTGVKMECGKGKAHPRTDHEAPDEESMYSYTLSLTSAVGVVGGQRHAPAALPPG